MSEIAKLYDQIMSEEQQNAGTEKVAADASADEGPEFNRDFFEKVASGDEEAVGVINGFIDEARAEGHSDEEIESAIGEAMVAAGYDENEQETVGDPEPDEFEQAKMSAYIEGSEQAITDVLASDLAKEAGVTIEDLIEYELGGHYGAGYAETRQEAQEAIAKIAEAKEAAAKEAGKVKDLGSKLMGKLKDAKSWAGGPGRTYQALREKGLGRAGAVMQTAKKRPGQMAAAGATLGGAGYGAYRMAKGRKDKE